MPFFQDSTLRELNWSLDDIMSSPSPERGRTRSRQQTSAYAKDPVPSRSRSSPRRSITPRSRTQSRSPPVVEEKLHRAKERRSRSRSPERSRSRSRGHDGSAHRYRDRSYTRSVSKDSPVPRSSKVGNGIEATPLNVSKTNTDCGRETHKERQ